MGLQSEWESHPLEHFGTIALSSKRELGLNERGSPHLFLQLRLSVHCETRGFIPTQTQKRGEVHTKSFNYVEICIAYRPDRVRLWSGPGFVFL